MVAEDSKNVEENGDGEAVKGVYEKGRHDGPGWYYVRPYTKNLYVFASYAVYPRKVTRRFLFKVIEVPQAQIRQDGGFRT